MRNGLQTYTQPKHMCLIHLSHRKKKRKISPFLSIDESLPFKLLINIIGGGSIECRVKDGGGKAGEFS